jgi:deoxyribodipyrimidine photolyase
MEDYLKDAKWVCGFEKPQTDPSAFQRPATTVLSPYLKFGCLSPRLFHSRLLALYRASKGTHSKPPVSLRGQLLWREFFYTVSVSAGQSCTYVVCSCRTTYDFSYAVSQKQGEQSLLLQWGNNECVSSALICVGIYTGLRGGLGRVGGL